MALSPGFLARGIHNIVTHLFSNSDFYFGGQQFSLNQRYSLRSLSVLRTSNSCLALDWIQDKFA